MDLARKNKLLYSRAGFGISPGQYKKPQPVDDVVNGLFPSTSPRAIEVVTQEEWAQHTPKAVREMREAGDTDAVKLARMQFERQVGDLNKAWMDEMVATQYPLLEKTALFWHGHFATRTENPYYDQLLLQVIRKNALGSFRVMLSEVSKSSAMIQFLNNQQNNKQHPNENFAREVMELFTLGRGNYAEQDVKEAARAFTGWTFDEYGVFSYKDRRHDGGEKLFLGRKGAFTGDDIINIILEQRQTAKFITAKLYRYFVSDAQPDERRIVGLAKDLYESDYDISGLLKKMFKADWFYSENVAGSKVKSPIELIVGYRRLMPIDFYDPRVELRIQRQLGQELFRPPNVAGWPGGLSWIDSSSLLVRMRLGETLLAGKASKTPEAEMQGEPQMDASVVGDEQQRSKPVRVGADWASYVAAWRGTHVDDLPRVLADYLLPKQLSKQQLNDVVAFANNDSTDTYVKSLTILLMGLPEYQVC